MTNKTIGGCVRTSCPDIFCRIDWARTPSWLIAHVHLAAAGIPGTRGINIGAVYGNSLILSTAKMSTPSRSRLSVRGDEDYFEWREAIERRQLESKRHMQTLLQETARLRKENVELRIQASSTGPSRGQRSRGQGANSRPNLESIYPGLRGSSPRRAMLDHKNETRLITTQKVLFDKL